MKIIVMKNKYEFDNNVKENDNNNEMSKIMIMK